MVNVVCTAEGYIVVNDCITIKDARIAVNYLLSELEQSERIRKFELELNQGYVKKLRKELAWLRLNPLQRLLTPFPAA